ncbi:hypothetical protein Pcinc_025111 [Petrolisthes cinctipes]|uniref:Uncharacterized protein n=1 Tax=Petrolisthes cinctipes TaxID=88211 RepID=A0AAE1KDH4_PETCI|nr:hypothetical protein Pcinc_025111 [Petrolisthes cinctipes]
MSVIIQEQGVRLFLARSPSREEVCALSKNDLMMVAREMQVEFVVDDLKEVILSRVCNRLFGGEFGEGATGSLFSEGEREAMSAQQMKHQLELAKVQAELQMNLAKEQTEQAELQMNLAKEQTEQARISLEQRKLENEHVLSEREINKRFDVPSQMRCINKNVACYLFERKVEDTRRAAVIADEYVLTHTQEFGQKSRVSCNAKGTVVTDVKSTHNGFVSPRNQSYVTQSREPRNLVQRGTIKSGDKMVPIKILRDTGSVQSLLLKNVFNDVTDVDNTVVLQGVGGFITVPLTFVQLDSDLVSGKVHVGLVDELPVSGVELLLGNDLAGGQVSRLPVLSNVPVNTGDTEKLERENPDFFPSCAVTRAMAKKDTEHLCSADSEANIDVLNRGTDENGMEIDVDFSLADIFMAKLQEGEQLGGAVSERVVVASNARPEVGWVSQVMHRLQKTQQCNTV